MVLEIKQEVFSADDDNDACASNNNNNNNLIINSKNTNSNNLRANNNNSNNDNNNKNNTNNINNSDKEEDEDTWKHCQLCRLSFRRITDLHKHLGRRHNPRQTLHTRANHSVLCVLCVQSGAKKSLFANARALKNHIRFKHPKTSLAEVLAANNVHNKNNNNNNNSDNNIGGGDGGKDNLSSVSDVGDDATTDNNNNNSRGDDNNKIKTKNNNKEWSKEEDELEERGLVKKRRCDVTDDDHVFWCGLCDSIHTHKITFWEHIHTHTLCGGGGDGGVKGEADNNDRTNNNINNTDTSKTIKDIGAPSIEHATKTPTTTSPSSFNVRQCSECGSMYAGECSLLMHMWLVHRVNEPLAKKVLGEFRNFCLLMQLHQKNNNNYGRNNNNSDNGGNNRNNNNGSDNRKNMVAIYDLPPEKLNKMATMQPSSLLIFETKNKDDTKTPSSEQKIISTRAKNKSSNNTSNNNNNNNNANNNKNNTPANECQVCHRAFNDIIELKMHMRVHGMAFIHGTRRTELG